MMLSLRHRCYLGAVALNNSAITLLERGHYYEATKVLRDSIKSMKHVPPIPTRDDVNESSRNKKNSSQSEETLLSELEKMLRNSASKIVESDSCVSQAHQNVDAHRVESQEVSTSLDQLNIRNLPRSPSMASFLPIRIETSSCELSSADPNFASAVILLNFSLAKMLYLTQHQHERSQLFINALHTATLASSIVSKRFSMIGIASNATDEREALLQLSLFILHCLYQLNIMLGDEVKAAQIAERYKLVRAELDDGLNSFPLRRPSSSWKQAKAA